MLFKLEGIKYATPMYLNVGYFHVWLSEKWNHMGVINSLDIFQDEMNECSKFLNLYIRIYITFRFYKILLGLSSIEVITYAK